MKGHQRHRHTHDAETVSGRFWQGPFSETSRSSGPPKSWRALCNSQEAGQSVPWEGMLHPTRFLTGPFPGLWEQTPCPTHLGGLTFQPPSSSAVLHAKAAALSFKCRGGQRLEHIPRQLPRDAGIPQRVPITLPGWVSKDSPSWVPTSCGRPGWSFQFLAFSLAYAQGLQSFGELQVDTSLSSLPFTLL